MNSERGTSRAAGSEPEKQKARAGWTASGTLAGLATPKPPAKAGGFNPGWKGRSARLPPTSNRPSPARSGPFHPLVIRRHRSSHSLPFPFFCEQCQHQINLSTTPPLAYALKRECHGECCEENQSVAWAKRPTRKSKRYDEKNRHQIRDETRRSQCAQLFGLCGGVGGFGCFHNGGA